MFKNKKNKDLEKDDQLKTSYTDEGKRIKNSFFASKSWYKFIIPLILLTILQEVIVASTDVIDNFFANILRPINIKENAKLEELNKLIEEHWWSQISEDILKELRLENYGGQNFKFTPAQIAINGLTASNQIFFIMFCTMIGFCYGAGIYVAQFYGAKDQNNLKKTVVIKIYISLIITTIVFMFSLFYQGSKMLIGSIIKYNPDLDKPIDEIIQTMDYNDPVKVRELYNYFQNKANYCAVEEGVKYFQVVAVSYPILAINTALITSMRETNRPMIAFVSAVLALIFNIILNIFLTNPNAIFGNGFNWDGLGLVGTAVGTIVSRVVQLVFIIWIVYWRKYECSLVFSSFAINWRLFLNVMRSSMGMVLNEILYAFSIVIQIKYRGSLSADAMTANGVYQTVVSMLLSPIYHGLSAAIAILIGANLGANKFDEAQYNAKHLLKLCIFISVTMIVIGIGAAFLFPLVIYNNISPTAKYYSVWLIGINAVIYPSILIESYFYALLRSGGKTIQALSIDALFNWIFIVPLIITTVTLVNANKLQLSIVEIHLIASVVESLKLIPGFIFYKKKKWLNNIIEKH